VIHELLSLRKKDKFSVLEREAYLHQARSTFHVVRAPSAIFSLNVGKVISNTQNAERISVPTVVSIISTIGLSVCNVQHKYPDNNRKYLLRIKFTTLARVSLLLQHLFYKLN